MNAQDLRIVRRWAGLIESGTVEQVRQACRENDRNGDFDDMSLEDGIVILVSWMHELAIENDPTFTVDGHTCDEEVSS